VITLTLLHPVQSTPVQHWNFDGKPLIRLGRAADNHVILYSAVVSRYHAELRWNGHQWELENQGANGTYVNGNRVHQALLEDGSLIRLARSGPTLQVRLNSATHGAQVAVEQCSSNSAPGPASPAQGSEEQLFLAQPAILADPPEPLTKAATNPSTSLQRLLTSMQLEEGGLTTVYQVEPPTDTCQHQRARAGDRFCIDCGSPLPVQSAPPEEESSTTS
jgi:pSer/pThr/pTyr-binding forkhead associated (FHA) protein